MTTDLQDYPEIPGVTWIVDYAFEPPQRKCLIEYDVNTLISLVDVADAAAHSQGRNTRLNGEIFREYLLRVVRELEARSLIDHQQWNATEHLAAAE
ncbi:hypothetical protein J2X12_002925 [Pseudarthrobacter oxydans]|uniref:Uncharacterized protein n=1 Tax=Pseudarthrobacter oxydans TaxID=1671 RepID=A0AAW8NB91_PSEOX|nr:hypothetical protein [Pseudarthrobacter oxydans]MDR6794338.1 hypothetical protein [Pseudarthrobacter oxydans]MDR7164887.1 hypothetical protein [Pseudarthrobacter oxydans]